MIVTNLYYISPRSNNEHINHEVMTMSNVINNNSDRVFLGYIGGTFVNGKGVAAYCHGGAVELIAETQYGKQLKRARVDRDEYEGILETVGDGLDHGDARISERALRTLGVRV